MILLSKDVDIDGTTYRSGDTLQVDKATEARLIADGSAEDNTIAKAVRDAITPEGKSRPTVSAEARDHNERSVYWRGAKPDQVARGFGEFALDIKASGRGHRCPNMDRHRNQMLAHSRAAYGGTYMSDAADLGDDLIPDDWVREITRIAWDYSTVYERCRRFPITGNTLQLPYLHEGDRATEGAGGRHGGIYGTFGTPGYQKTEVAAKPDKLSLTLKEISMLVPVTDALLEDNAVALGQFLLTLMGEALGYKIEQSIIRGTTFDDSLLHDTSTLFVARTTANTIVWADIVEMFSHICPPMLRRAIWLFSPRAIAEMLKLESTSGFPIFMAGGAGFPTAASGVPTTVLGLPWALSEHASDLGTEGDVMLADFSQYIIAEKARGVEMASSIHLHFDYDITTFRAVQRINGEPWMPVPITMEQGDHLLSWAVALDNATGTAVATGPTA